MIGVPCKTLPHRCQYPGVGPDLRMARHAGIRGWHPGIPCVLHTGMAEATIESETRHMMLMAEGDRLLHRPCGVAAIIHARPDPPPGDATHCEPGETE